MLENLPYFKQHLHEDLDKVNVVINQAVKSDVALISQIGTYIISAGGKRLRPIITILAGKAVGYDDEKLYSLAAMVEFIHTSTLLHDDVVDESDLRRGRKTANNLFGNAAAVLVGDFLYTRAFQLMVASGSMKILEVMADATNIIAEGEVMQLMNIGNTDITEKQYIQVIQYKTAKLFEAAAQVGAILGGANPAQEQALKDYNLEYEIQDVKDWYNGYKFGESEVYNPWSILNFLKDGKLAPYWIDTSGNFLINQILKNTDSEIMETLEALFNGETVEENISGNSDLSSLLGQEEIWELLLFSGYLTIDEKIGEDYENVYTLRLPNREVKEFFKQKFKKHIFTLLTLEKILLF